MEQLRHSGEKTVGDKLRKTLSPKEEAELIGSVFDLPNGAVKRTYELQPGDVVKSAMGVFVIEAD